MPSKPLPFLLTGVPKVKYNKANNKIKQQHKEGIKNDKK